MNVIVTNMNRPGIGILLTIALIPAVALADPVFRVSQLDGSNGTAIRGFAGANQLGRAVANIGDVNADGFEDIVFASPNADPNGQDSGIASVVFGQATPPPHPVNLPSLSSSTGFHILGAAAFDYVGSSVAAAGDVNGDGFGDFVIGAPASSLGAEFAGAVYVVFGSDQGFPDPLDLSQAGPYHVIVTSEAGAELGASVAGAGDLDGDGIDDLLIGAPLANSSGAAYVVFGSDVALPDSVEVLNGSNGFTMTAVGSADNLGQSVAGNFDLNSDGQDDIVVGAPLAGTEGAFNGAAYVVFGSNQAFPAVLDLATLDGEDGLTIVGVANSDEFGASVAAAGNINSDGHDDLIIGAPKSDPGGQSIAGRSYVVFGSDSPFVAELSAASLNGSNGFALAGDEAGAQSGAAVAGRLDLNRDGIDDAVVGAPTSSLGGADSGAAYVVYGKAGGWGGSVDLSSMTGAAGQTVAGKTGDDQFGAALSQAGDVNNDGWQDLLVGAPLADTSATSSGEAYLIYSVDLSEPDILFADGFE